MDPFAINVLDSIEMEAAGIIPFGAAVIKSGTGTIVAAQVESDNDIIGFADSCEVEKDVPGFYATYDTVRVITAGRFNAWVLGNGGAVTINAGEYLEVGNFGDNAPGGHGILVEDSAAGGTRSLHSCAKAMEDVVMAATDYQTPTTAASGSTTLTFSAANLTSLNVSDGDYIFLEDVSENAQVNRVKSQTSTVITLEKATTITLTSGDTDLVHKMFQCEAMILL